MNGKNDTCLAVVFEYYEYRAKNLPLPKAAYSVYHDNHREVFLIYAEGDARTSNLAEKRQAA